MTLEHRLPALPPLPFLASYELSQDLCHHVSGCSCKELLQGTKGQFSRETHENYSTKTIGGGNPLVERDVYVARFSQAPAKITSGPSVVWGNVLAHGSGS